MVQEFKDTYFLSFESALEVAKQQNMLNGAYKQVCYYDGDEVQSEFNNLINVPFDDIVSYFISSNKRIPRMIDLDGLELSAELSQEITDLFVTLVQSIDDAKEKHGQEILKEVKNSKIDFSEPLRIYVGANQLTRVMQYASQNIANAFKKAGYEVMFDVDTELEDMSYYRILKNIYKFKPHIYIAINHNHRFLLSDDTFQVIWYQDLMPEIANRIKTVTAKKDLVFHLTVGFGMALEQIGIKSNYQPFCIDSNVYTFRENIKREDKIVFVGSSYQGFFESVDNDDKYKVVEDLLPKYVKEGIIEQDELAILETKYSLTHQEFGSIINYILRDLMIKEILKLNLDIKIEIYGYGFDKDKDILPYYKGLVEFGENVSKIYNSAKYCLVLGGYVMQQRTLEAIASGSLPLLFDVRKIDLDYDDKFEDLFLFFKIPKNISKLIKHKNEVDNTKRLKLLNNHSYKGFVEKIISLVKK